MGGGRARIWPGRRENTCNCQAISWARVHFLSLGARQLRVFVRRRVSKSVDLLLSFSPPASLFPCASLPVGLSACRPVGLSARRRFHLQLARSISCAPCLSASRRRRRQRSAPLPAILHLWPPPCLERPPPFPLGGSSSARRVHILNPPKFGLIQARPPKRRSARPADKARKVAAASPSSVDTSAGRHNQFDQIQSAGPGAGAIRQKLARGPFV